jgi:hypothetical protein
MADTLERFIVEAVLHHLDSPALASALDGAEAPSELLTAARLEAETSGRELEQLATAYGERQITWTEFLAARKPIEGRVVSAKRALARQSRASAVQPYVGASSKLREAWPDPTARRGRGRSRSRAHRAGRARSHELRRGPRRARLARLTGTLYECRHFGDRSRVLDLDGQALSRTGALGPGSRPLDQVAAHRVHDAHTTGGPAHALSCEELQTRSGSEPMNSDACARASSAVGP